MCPFSQHTIRLYSSPRSANFSFPLDLSLSSCQDHSLSSCNSCLFGNFTFIRLFHSSSPKPNKPTSQPAPTFILNCKWAFIMLVMFQSLLLHAFYDLIGGIVDLSDVQCSCHWSNEMIKSIHFFRNYDGVKLVILDSTFEFNFYEETMSYLLFSL